MMPEHVQIGATRYRVSQSGDDLDWLKSEKGDKDGYVGRTVHRQQLIVVSPDCGADEERNTFLHEVLHGVNAQYDFGLVERQIAGVATAILDTLRRNPDILAYLIPEEEQADERQQE